jgi:hypothetical protein
MTETEVKKISWMLGFDTAANWELTPLLDRKYDAVGNCINETRRIEPGHEAYQDPEVAFTKKTCAECGSICVEVKHDATGKIICPEGLL